MEVGGSGRSMMMMMSAGAGAVPSSRISKQEALKTQYVG
jgi:hypothetical protein